MFVVLADAGLLKAKRKRKRVTCCIDEEYGRAFIWAPMQDGYVKNKTQTIDITHKDLTF